MKKLLCVISIVLAVMASSAFALACGGHQDGGSQTGGNNPNGGGEVTYSVTWKDENGTTLTTTNVESGNVPSYTYAKQDTAEWHYTVSGWSNELGGAALSALPAATGDATYYAVVAKTKRKYNVAFKYADGNTALDAITKEYGDTVSEPSDKPTKENMRFIGWCVDEACKTRAEFPITVSGNVTLYAAFVNKVDVKSLLAKLLDGYKLDPYSYIPEAMLPKYVRSDVNTSVKGEADYGSFVNKSQMPHNGFGEQWHMITDNLAQSELFFNALSVVETVSAEAVAAFNNYIDSNPDDTAHHEFKHGIYNVTVDCGEDYIYFVLDYTATFPLVGEQNAQIALRMSYDETNKTVRIQLGDANALKYSLTDNGYKFALKLLGVRRAMFEIKRDGSGKVTGHINEFLTASGVTDMAKASAADFYIRRRLRFGGRK